MRFWQRWIGSMLQWAALVTLQLPFPGCVSPSILRATGQSSSSTPARWGLEGIVSKRRDLPYRSGRVKCWLKVKNPASPAALRIMEEGTW
jgi:hypothetical protein